MNKNNDRISINNEVYVINEAMLIDVNDLSIGFVYDYLPDRSVILVHCLIFGKKEKVIEKLREFGGANLAIIDVFKDDSDDKSSDKQ